MTKFFAEWKDDKRKTFLALVILFFVGTTLTGIFNNFPEEQGNAQVFITLATVAGILIIIETMFEERNFFRTLGMGKKPLIALAAGVVIGLILQSTGQIVIPTPFAATISTDVILSFFYIIVAAVLIEELFFRGVFQPVTTGLLHDYLKLDVNTSGAIALVAQAGMFSWYHWRVLGGAEALLMVTFAFAVIVTVGNYYFKSLGFGIGAHGINNYIAWIARVGGI